MIRAAFIEPVDDPDWKRWRSRAIQGTAALQQLVSEGKAPNIKRPLYKASQRWILPAFHGKCAYCEVKMTADQNRGEVEHYRPKAAVSDAEGNLVFVCEPGTEQKRPHPGYYWLAYQWQNLLPSCISCNRLSKVEGKVYGKFTRFPVMDNDYRWHPDREGEERPVLLNPWFDDPNEHLGFSLASGVIAWKTPRGKANIDILGLNRDKLVELRKGAFRAASLEAKEYLEAMGRNDDAGMEAFIEKLHSYQRGEPDFCAFRLAAVHDQRDRALKGLLRIA